MEFFQFCLEIINREVKKCNVAFDTSGLKTFTIDSANDRNYDDIKKRCLFLYRCGTINLYFAENCFRTFLLDNKIAKDLLSKWKDCTDLTFCSFSTGPALDYVAFLHSFQKSGMTPPVFKKVNIISKYSTWKSTTNVMHEVINEGFLKSLPSRAIGNIKVIQGNPFKQFAQNIKSSINNSDVVMMMNCGYNQKEISKSIQVILDALKPGAVFFCIDTKQRIKEISQLLNLLPGTFLLKPSSMETKVNFDFPSVIKKHVGCLPILSAQGRFLVWQKSSLPTQLSTSTVNHIAESYKHKLNLDTDKKVLSGMNIAGECSGESSLKSNFSRQSAITSSSPIIGDYQLETDVKSRSDLHLPSTSSLNASIQIETDGKLHETEEIKIMELVRKIENLTIELTKLLADNESRCNTDCCSFKQSSDSCRNLDSNDHIHGQCASAISRSRLTGDVQNCETCYDHHDAFSECCILDDHATINVASCNCYGCKVKSPPINHSLPISSQSNSPQLVIPLANLPTSVVSQIVSLVSQSQRQQMENFSQTETDNK